MGTHEPSKKALDAMAGELDDTCKRRAQFSRRRQVYTDGTIDYINERNRRFNLKVSRAFDKHTAHLRAALERGTA
ncbi:MAG: hypothetical protein MHM6MM_008449 [Cercozoa sp. M6MM]